MKYGLYCLAQKNIRILLDSYERHAIDENGVYVYSLGDFTAQQGVRDTTDIMEKYRRGALGALPDPELIGSLLDMKGNRREVSVSGE